MTFTFNELSEKSQKRAISDYKLGWEVTHEKGDLSDDEIRDILRDGLTEERYSKEGKLL